MASGYLRLGKDNLDELSYIDEGTTHWVYMLKTPCNLEEYFDFDFGNWKSFPKAVLIDAGTYKTTNTNTITFYSPVFCYVDETGVITHPYADSYDMVLHFDPTEKRIFFTIISR